MLRFSPSRCAASDVQTLDMLRAASSAALLASCLAFGTSVAADPSDGATPGSPSYISRRGPGHRSWEQGALAWSREAGNAPDDRAFSPATVIHEGTLKTAGDPGPSGRLLFLMQSEAVRYRKTRPAIRLESLEPSDSLAEEQRARHAERIVTRAFSRTLDESLEHLARTSLGLSGLLEWMDDVGGIRLRLRRSQSADDSWGRAGPAGAPRSGADPGFRASLALRLDARPRLVLRTEFLGIRGRIEAAAPGEPIRLNFERPLGPRSRAALRAGLEREGRDWAAFTFDFTF